MSGVDDIFLGRIVECTMIPLFVIFVSLMPRQKRVKFTKILIIFVILWNDLQSRLYYTSVIFHKSTVRYQGKDPYPFSFCSHYSFFWIEICSHVVHRDGWIERYMKLLPCLCQLSPCNHFSWKYSSISMKYEQHAQQASFWFMTRYILICKFWDQMISC